MVPSQGTYSPAQKEEHNTTGTIKRVITEYSLPRFLGVDLKLTSVDQGK